MAGCPNVLRHWDGILQLLARKADLERKYLDRLEGRAGLCAGQGATAMLEPLVLPGTFSCLSRVVCYGIIIPDSAGVLFLL